MISAITQAGNEDVLIYSNGSRDGKKIQLQDINRLESQYPGISFRDLSLASTLESSEEILTRLISMLHLRSSRSESTYS